MTLRVLSPGSMLAEELLRAEVPQRLVRPDRVVGVLPGPEHVVQSGQLQGTRGELALV